MKPRWSGLCHSWALVAAFLIVSLLVAPALVPEAIAAGRFSEKQGVSEKSIEIENGRLAAGDSEDFPVDCWYFESPRLVVDSATGRNRVLVEPGDEAALRIPGDGKGVILEGKTDMARIDLRSMPFEVEPFHWVNVTVEYQIESGGAAPFVCLFPRADRSLVDLEFLPAAAPGTKRTATIKLHSGESTGSYCLCLSLIGKGAVRFFSVDASEGEAFPRCAKSAFVLDMLHVDPPRNGKLGWKNAEKLVTVFGFSSLEHLHFKEVTPEKLAHIDPALIVLSPKSEEIGRNEVNEIMEAIKTVTGHGVPVVGICLGHQVLAMAHGGDLSRKYDEGPDGEEILLNEFGDFMIRIVKDDPIFARLPRAPFFCASESHNSMVHIAFEGAELLASTEICDTQIYRYPGKPWYTFQAHIERNWEFACAESYIIWKNILRHFFLAP